MNMLTLPVFDDVIAAAARIKGQAHRTPVMTSRTINDALGAEIALRAGFDPLKGAAFFDRLPDPGQSFLNTHPPNAIRKEVVAGTVRRLTGN